MSEIYSIDVVESQLQSTITDLQSKGYKQSMQQGFGDPEPRTYLIRPRYSEHDFGKMVDQQGEKIFSVVFCSQ